MELSTNALLGVIGSIIVAMLTLIISTQFDLKKEIHEIWMAMNNKQDKSECVRQMDKQEQRLRELDDRKTRRANPSN